MVLSKSVVVLNYDTLVLCCLILAKAIGSLCVYETILLFSLDQNGVFSVSIFSGAVEVCK